MMYDVYILRYSDAREAMRDLSASLTCHKWRFGKLFLLLPLTKLCTLLAQTGQSYEIKLKKLGAMSSERELYRVSIRIEVMTKAVIQNCASKNFAIINLATKRRLSNLLYPKKYSTKSRPLYGRRHFLFTLLSHFGNSSRTEFIQCFQTYRVCCVHCVFR